MSSSQHPTILFLHGFAESREVWTDFTREFPDGYRLLTLNLLGHGTNVHDIRDYSMEAQARYVAEQLRQKSVEKALLVCHSMGGYVALAFAERYPEMMAGLVLSFPVISYQMWRFVAPGLYRNEKAAFLPFLPGDQHVACLRSLTLPDDPLLFQQVHQPAGAGEPDLQLALQHAGRPELGADHQLRGLVQQLLVVARSGRPSMQYVKGTR